MGRECRLFSSSFRPLRVRGRCGLAAGLFLLVILLTALYASLSVYKAYDYTSTPAQSLGSETPRDRGLAYEDVAFESAGDDAVMLSGWWVPAPSSTRAIVLVHGRYQNRTAFLPLLQPLVDRGFNVVAFDLRGHGQSAPSSAFYGLREQHDVVAAVRWVESRGFQRESIAVLGWSLGATSVLIALPDLPGLGAVISDSAYADDAPLLARNLLWPGLRLAMRFTRGVNLADVRPVEDVAMSTTPLLIVHGSADMAVPVDHARRLSAAASGRAEL